MKKTKLLVSMAVAALAILGTYTTAFADAGAYAIKDTKTNSIRQYDLKSLTDSFLSNKLGQGNDLLFKEFKEDQGKNGVHAIYDNSKKYINYIEAVKALEEGKVSGKEFKLNEFLKEAKAGETPNYVYERKISGEKIVNGLNITKEGFELDLSKEVLEAYEDIRITVGKVTIANGTITGKLLVDAGKDAEVTVKNVKTDSITGLSGSLKLEAVEAKELVIEKSLSLSVDAASKLTKLSITAPKGSEIVLSGNLGAVEINSAVKVIITAGSNVDVKIVNDEAKDITVVAEAGATVTTDKPISNTEGSGTVTQPGGTTGGVGGGGGGTSLSSLETLIKDNVNNSKGFVNLILSGYITVDTYSQSTNTVTVNLPASTDSKDITVGELYTKTQTFMNSMLSDEDDSALRSLLFAAIGLKGEISNEYQDKIKADIISALIAKGKTEKAQYLEENGYIAFILNEMRNGTTYDGLETILTPNDREYTNISLPVVDGYTLSQVKVKVNDNDGEIVYSTSDNNINMDQVKELLGITVTKDTKLSTLKGKTIELKFTKGSTTEIYNVKFK